MSTTSGDASKPSSQNHASGEGQTGTDAKFEFSWQGLSSMDNYINSSQWSNRPIPTIIDSVPQNVDVNNIIQQILQWSRQRVDDFSQGLEVDDGAAESAASSENVVSPNPSTEIQPMQNQDPAHIPATITDTSETSSISSGVKTRKANPLLSRLKQIRQDMANKLALKSQVRTVPVIDATAVPTKDIPAKGECISCFDEFADAELVHLSCSHDYCKACLREVILNAVKTESAFPPKCCLSEIPLKTVLTCLDERQRNEYKEKSAEYSIPAGHRWYCPEPTCAKWIKPEKLHRIRRNHQTCPHCKVKICSICRSLAHDNDQDCPQDFGLESTLEVAESEGWQRCYSCRTMVELTTGCRHMTCRCGAEFCYVCNAKWRTCSCTEADKERRLQEIRTRREQREQLTREEEQRQQEEDEAALAEAEELAEAIRQIEEMERQDAIRQAEEERQRQIEEELALARLEEARLLEEIARRDAEEEAERQFRAVLLASSKEECQTLMKALMQIINFQHAALISSHTALENTCVQEYSSLSTRIAEENSEMSDWLEENIARRSENLHNKQREEWEHMLRQGEEEEDEMFMQITLHLRGKSNKEQREKKMRDAFQSQQLDKQSVLQAKHDRERQKLDMGSQFEREGLQKAANFKLEPLNASLQTSLRNAGTQVGSDRKWFQLISTRRIEMMKEHRRLVLEQLEADQEPVGLSEAQARLIEPHLPAVEDTYSTLELVVDVTDVNGTSAPVLRNNKAFVDRPVSDVSSTKDFCLDSPVSAIDDAHPWTQLATPTPDVVNQSQLLRSNTVIRHIPGAYPASLTDSPNRNTYPPATPKAHTLPSNEPQPTTKQRTHVDSGISMANLIAMSFVVEARDDISSSSPTAENTAEPSSEPITQPENDSFHTLSPQSSTSNITITTTNTTHTSGSASSTLEPDSDLLDSICASKVASSASSHRSRDSGKKARRLFGSLRTLGAGGAGKELTEAEIRRRMSLCVGDGFCG